MTTGITGSHAPARRSVVDGFGVARGIGQVRDVLSRRRSLTFTQNG